MKDHNQGELFAQMESEMPEIVDDATVNDRIRRGMHAEASAAHQAARHADVAAALRADYPLARHGLRA